MDAVSDLIAYHEVGHALVGTLVKHMTPVQKVTLIPAARPGPHLVLP